MKTLSIIIPAYNVEKYIGETLDSIVTWSDARKDVEVIVVDDGSPDNLSDIVIEYQKKHDNIILIRQENKAAGGARNTGIEHANGEYLWFVDADDWVVSDSLAMMLNVLKEEKPEALAICASNFVADRDIKQRFNFDGLPSWSTGPEMLGNGRFSLCAPFTIYSRSYLNNNKLRFQEHLFHEDNDFTPRAYYGLRRLRLFNVSLYLVRQNPNSITRSVNFKKNFDLLKAARSLYDFKIKNVKDRKIQKAFDFIISKSLNNALSNSSDMNDEVSKQFLKEVRNHKYLFTSFLNSPKIKFKLQGLLFFLIPVNPVTLYNLTMKK